MTFTKNINQIFKNMPLAVRVSLLGLWIPVISSLVFIPFLIRLSFMLILLFGQWLLIRKPLREMKDSLYENEKTD